MKITVDAAKCVGCRICELECSFRHERVFGRSQSRIRVTKLEDVGLDLPHLCRQCNNTPCVTACPTATLSVNSTTGAIVAGDNCSGCGACVSACPFGAANLHPQTGKVLICDLCDGSPACVAGCPTGALTLDSGDSLTAINLEAERKRGQLAEKAATRLLRDWGLSK